MEVTAPPTGAQGVPEKQDTVWDQPQDAAANQPHVSADSVGVPPGFTRWTPPEEQSHRCFTAAMPVAMA